MTQHTESRYDRGARALAQIDGEAGQKVIASLADIAPDFARYVIEFPFGDIYSRPGLDRDPARSPPSQLSRRWVQRARN